MCEITFTEICDKIYDVFCCRYIECSGVISPEISHNRCHTVTHCKRDTFNYMPYYEYGLFSYVFNAKKCGEQVKGAYYFSYLVRGRILLQNSRGFHSSETHNVQSEYLSRMARPRKVGTEDSIDDRCRWQFPLLSPINLLESRAYKGW